MCSKYVLLILFPIILQQCDAERRIRNGVKIAGEKRYMCYLSKAPSAPANYDAWLCGGAIVTTTFILTAAACVEDVQHMYAIAGYNKYVKYDKIASDSCTKHARKKVTLTCVPKNSCTKHAGKKVTLTCVPKKYQFAYDKIEKWGSIDIALVQVESPYDFKAPHPLPSCSWVPDKIDINYDPKYQEPGIDSIVFGWGHTTKWRKPNDPIDYNQEILQYVPILLQPKTKCKRYFSTNPSLLSIIDKYMICAWDTGNLNDKGHVIVKSKPTAEGCTPNKRGECVEKRRLGRAETMINNSNDEAEYVEESPIQDSPIEESPIEESPIEESHFEESHFEESHVEESHTEKSHIEKHNAHKDTGTHPEAEGDGKFLSNDKNGICQNDHGGPMITWVGSHEVIIGVASVFRVSGQSDCVGPYLFTSTQCNSAFIDCIINPKGARKTNVCDLPPVQRGFDIIKRRITWAHHPDGPADNEKDLTFDLLMRPQIPLHKYTNG